MVNLEMHNLFDQARNDRGPDLDVADSVMRTLANSRPLGIISIERPLMWASLISSAAAAALVMVAFLTQQQPDAINNVIAAVSWAAQ